MSLLLLLLLMQTTMVKPIKDETGKWRVGDSPGAYIFKGPEYTRIHQLAMNLQKKCKSIPCQGCSASFWLNHFKPDWVEDPVAFCDCWNHICKIQEMDEHHRSIQEDLDDDEKEFCDNEGHPCCKQGEQRKSSQSTAAKGLSVSISIWQIAATA